MGEYINTRCTPPCWKMGCDFLESQETVSCAMKKGGLNLTLCKERYGDRFERGAGNLKGRKRTSEIIDDFPTSGTLHLPLK